MSYEHKPGEFSIFKNESKSRDTDRDYEGSGKTLDGADVWVSAWINTKKDGQNFLKITYKLKGQEQSISRCATPKGPAKRSIIPDDDMNGDGIPF